MKEIQPQVLESTSQWPQKILAFTPNLNRPLGLRGHAGLTILWCGLRILQRTPECMDSFAKLNIFQKNVVWQMAILRIFSNILLFSIKKF
jgi:hypothetical protein